MQVTLQKLTAPKSLHLVMLVVGIVILVANFYGREIATTTTNLLYLPTSGALIVLSILLTVRFRGKGEHGKSWIMFSAFAFSWFLAEYVRYAHNIIYENPYSFPIFSHWMYYVGYAFLFLFSILYMRPVEKAISKKMLVSSFLISMSFLLPATYIVYYQNQNANWHELMVTASHPMADAIVMFPASIGIILFFKGQVNFLWAAMCVAITLNIIADTSQMILSSPDYHYLRSPLDILYLWGYILFAFGVYSHIKIFKHYKMNYYKNLEDLR